MFVIRVDKCIRCVFLQDGLGWSPGGVRVGGDVLQLRHAELQQHVGYAAVRLTHRLQQARHRFSCLRRYYFYNINQLSYVYFQHYFKMKSFEPLFLRCFC